MTIIIKIEENKYTVHTPVDFPDAKQFMSSIEKIIKQLEYPEKEIEDYILDWATEIKLNRDGKD